MSRMPELIAPAGNMECAHAAVANGADAVYFGLPRFNARRRADNFTEEQLPELVRFLHDHHVRAFCTVNTLIFTDELADAERELIRLDEAGVDVVIVQDLGLAVLAQKLGVRMDVHASTQMTITSPEGVRFAAKLGIKRVVIARETSLRELAKFDHGNPSPALEVFVHGALCVAYSGQCLTSEALGQRSANRGECAQACRLPYELIVDGVRKDMGDRRYLLSPQDLAAVKEIPELIRLGVTGFKIEGRLKSPEYVAATCQVYRKAIDAALAGQESPITNHDFHKLEMTFSRGLYSGWLHGVNHQKLVHARFGKKRGPFVGFVRKVQRDGVEVDAVQCPLRAGDGVVFDTGGDTEKEQGGALFAVRGNVLEFRRGQINFSPIKAGDRVWKTSDPRLMRQLRKSFAGEIPAPKQRIDVRVTGKMGKHLCVEAGVCRVESSMPLQFARKRPLTTELLRGQLGRLGGTRFKLGKIRNELEGDVILPVSELNRLRRELVARLLNVGGLPAEAGPTTPRSTPDERRSPHGLPCDPSSAAVLRRVEAATQAKQRGASPIELQGRSGRGSHSHIQSVLPQVLEDVGSKRTSISPGCSAPQLVVLCRTMEQIGAALDVGCTTLYADFEDIRRYRDAVSLVRTTRSASRSTIFLATPRIQKADEQGFFQIIQSAQPDGALIRNLGALDFFRSSPLRAIGDFSLNVANPIAADLLIREGLGRLTVSYDLNAQQVLDLLMSAPPDWFEITIHQHMPMFHMEHCVFAAFLSKGADHTNCGRPCDRHNLKLRDRVGMEHPVKADVGCRNTVFHAKAQSGADYLRDFIDAGARVFRVELLEENAARSREILQCYRALLDGVAADSNDTLQRLGVVRQLGLTSGTLTVLS